MPVALMTLADPRRRPIVATVAYALALFTVMAARLAGLPAFRPMVPGAPETLAALVVTLVAAVAGGFAAARLAALLDPEPAPRPGRVIIA